MRICVTLGQDQMVLMFPDPNKDIKLVIELASLLAASESKTFLRLIKILRIRTKSLISAYQGEP